MKRLVGISVVLGLLGAFAGACTVTDAAKPFPDVATFCTAKAKAECQISPTCAIDAAGCQTARDTKCLTDATAATGSGTRTYTPDNAQACIDAVNKVYATGKVLLSDLVGTGSMGDTCERVFSGVSDVNKSCTSDFDCIKGRICSPTTPGGTTLVCADKADVALGGFCSNPGSACASGSYCAPATTSAAAQCTASAQMGQACSATLPCIDTLRCSGAICTPRQGPGQACTSNDDCSPTAGYCDAYAGNICTIGLTFATGALDCHGYTTATTPTPDAGAVDSSTTDASTVDASTSDATGD